MSQKEREQGEAATEPPIARWVLPLPPLDPLVVLAQLGSAYSSSFYWENAAAGEASVAFGRAWEGCTRGKGRFEGLRAAISAGWRAMELGGVSCPLAALPHTPPRLWCAIPFFPGPVAAPDPTGNPQGDRLAPSSETVARLPAWQVTQTLSPDGTRQSYLSVNRRLASGDDRLGLEQGLRQALRLQHTLSQLAAQGPPLQPSQYRLASLGASSDRFLASAEAAIAAINRGELTKIVLADTIDLTATAPLQAAALLANLRHHYGDCYLFAVGDGAGRTFLGASPECLVRLRDGRAFADALAGSAPRGTEAASDRHWGQELLASPKDRHEHRLVVEFLRDRLASLGATVEAAPAPCLRKLANIQHLHTPIRALLPPGLDPLAIVAALHPTPAVAGLPIEPALAAIARLEPFDRGLYAGAIGWLDAAGEAEFAVGIRSALVEGERARLYAGAGLVAGSDPERERAEVQLKLRALLSALV